MSGRGPLWWLLPLVAVLLLGCDPIQTGIIQLRVVTQGAEGLLPVVGASCAREGVEGTALSDAEGRLQWAGAEVGAQQVHCQWKRDGGFLGGVSVVEVPLEAGRAGLAFAEVELLSIDAPGGAEAIAGPRAATVSWRAPVRTGGAPVLGYVLQTLPDGPSFALDAATSAFTVTGLNDGASYSFEIAAHTLHGLGPAARTGTVKLPQLPTSPMDVTATPGVRSALIKWTAPDDDGGAPLLAFHVTALPGGERRTVDGAVTSLEFDGLEGGASYAFTVSAENAVGEGPASKPSETVVPASVGAGGG